MMKTALAAMSATLVAVSVTGPAAAGNDDRRGYHGHSHVVKVLRDNGFVSWREIERDDGKWEVDDARHHNGRVYDLDIRGGRIVKWDRD
jgi:hypothetical protein